MKLPTLALVVITGLFSLPALSDTHGWQHFGALLPMQHQEHDTWAIQLNHNDGKNHTLDNHTIAEDFIFAVQWSMLWQAASLWTRPSNAAEHPAAPRPVLLFHYDEQLPNGQQQAMLEEENGIYLGAKMLF